MIVLSILLLSVVAQAQFFPARSGFDVASIKPAMRGEISPSNPMYLRPGSVPGSLEAKNAFLTFLISNAYDVKMAHISLLEQRFHLRVHRETRQLQVFVLTVATGGLMVQPEDCVIRGAYRPPEPGLPSPRFCGTYSLLRFGAGWRLTGIGITMKDLARALSFQEMPTLIEKTGHIERFNAVLEWTPDSVAGSPVTLPDDAAPSLSTALQEQLGIKLESGRGPVEVLVIDHVERPSEN